MNNCSAKETKLGKLQMTSAIRSMNDSRRHPFPITLERASEAISAWWSDAFLSQGDRQGGSAFWSDADLADSVGCNGGAERPT